MKPTSLFSLLASCSAIFVPLVSLADELPDSKLFDKNSDGHLDQAELDIYSLHVQDKRFRDWDKNRDGKIEMSELADEIQKANDARSKIIEQQRMIAANNASAFQVDLSQPISGEEADEVLRVSRPRPKYKPTWFRLRGKVSDFAVAPPKGNIEKINPAIFSWGRDFVADGDTWTARGAIGGFWENSWSDLSLGAEFDRLATNVPGKTDTDTLIFRGMGSRELDLGSNPPLVGALALRYGLDYGTNFDFDGATLGGALEIEPLWKLKAFTSIQSLLGKGNGWSALNAPSVSLRNYVRIEGGGTVDDFPGKPADNDNYLRIGPQVEMVFWPFGTTRPVSLTTSYGYWAEVAGKGRDYHNFRAGADWRLDEAGHFSLRLEYVSGLTPLLLQEQDSVLLSLSAPLLI